MKAQNSIIPFQLFCVVYYTRHAQTESENEEIGFFNVGLHRNNTNQPCDIRDMVPVPTII